MSCQFCGAEKITVETPFIDRVTGKHEVTFCCKAQSTQKKYERSPRRYNPELSTLEKLEDVCP